MRPWASWAAKTAVFSLAAGLAATAAGSAAWAASDSAALAARGGRHHRRRRGRRHAGPPSPERRGRLGKPARRRCGGDAHRARLPCIPFRREAAHEHVEE